MISDGPAVRSFGCTALRLFLCLWHETSFASAKMATILRSSIWLAALLAMSGAQSIVPTNWTAQEAAKTDAETVMMQISIGQKMVPLAPVLALTEKAGSAIPVSTPTIASQNTCNR